MSKHDPWQDLYSLPEGESPWNLTWTVAPLVLVGSLEPDGGHDLAPKHLAMPLSWSRHYGFVCSPRHRTYVNIVREGAFTVSFPTPEHLVETALAADPRTLSGDKPGLAALPVFPAREVRGVLVRDCYFYLECRLLRVYDDFGENSLIAGEVVTAHVDKTMLHTEDLDGQEEIHRHPLLAYLHPDRFTSIDRSNSFPFPRGYHR